jgi:hypothetical protein
MYHKMHRWSDEEQEISEAPETQEEPRERYDFELEELRGHRVREIASDDD